MEVLSLENINYKCKKNNQTYIPCVVTIGMYDGVHIGHQQMLQELVSMAQQSNYKSIVITFTNHPRSILDTKKDNPIQLLQTIEERFKKISQFGVDYIIPITFTKELAALSPKQFLDLLLKHLDIKVLLLGYDNRFGAILPSKTKITRANNQEKKSEFYQLLKDGIYRNIKIQKDNLNVCFQDIEVSSTQIRKAIIDGNISIANSMLGYPYSMSSKIVKGFQNGRQLGFPTANIVINCEKIIPHAGVYATNSIIDSIRYYSITNIGKNPTFNAQQTTIETYIIDFNSDIYNKEITIEFNKFIRNEQKFATPEELSMQINSDLEYAKKFFCM